MGSGCVSDAQVAAAARQLGIPAWVVRAQLDAEGGCGATSFAGAQGPAQFLPSTWRSLGCSGSPFDPAAAMVCYAKYMGQLLHQFGGNVRNALAAYNAGPGNIGAGMGYADQILRGQKVSVGTGSQPGGSPYVYPIGTGLQQGRIDEGVDWSGRGPLYAMGAGQITNVSSPGWPGGAFIGLHLTAPGAYQGRYVYYAEDITPSVKVGQQVQAGQQIGMATGGHSGIEVGWAAPPGTGRALAAPHYTEGMVTQEGRDFLAAIKSLASGGQGSGGNQLGSGDTQEAQLTSFWGDIGNWVNPFNWISDIGKLMQGSIGAVTDLPHALGQVVGFLNEFLKIAKNILHDIEWLFVPSHWVRIIAFAGGSFFLVPGLYFLTKAGQGDMGLALGILFVTISGVLFFISFHNLPDDVKNLRALLGWISEGIQAGKAPASVGG